MTVLRWVYSCGHSNKSAICVEWNVVIHVNNAEEICSFTWVCTRAPQKTIAVFRRCCAANAARWKATPALQRGWSSAPTASCSSALCAPVKIYVHVLVGWRENHSARQAQEGNYSIWNAREHSATYSIHQSNMMDTCVWNTLQYHEYMYFLCAWLSAAVPPCSTHETTKSVQHMHSSSLFPKNRIKQKKQKH